MIVANPDGVKGVIANSSSSSLSPMPLLFRLFWGAAVIVSVAVAVAVIDRVSVFVAATVNVSWD